MIIEYAFLDYREGAGGALIGGAASWYTGEQRRPYQTLSLIYGQILTSYNSQLYCSLITGPGAGVGAAVGGLGGAAHKLDKENKSSGIVVKEL